MRDGETVIAVGVLTIPRKTETITVVVHADRCFARVGAQPIAPALFEPRFFVRA